MRAGVARFIGTPQAQHELRNIRCWGDGPGNKVAFGEKRVVGILPHFVDWLTVQYCPYGISRGNKFLRLVLEH